MTSYTVKYVTEALKGVDAQPCGPQETQVTIRLPAIDGRTCVLCIIVPNDGTKIESMRMDVDVIDLARKTELSETRGSKRAA